MRFDYINNNTRTKTAHGLRRSDPDSASSFLLRFLTLDASVTTLPLGSICFGSAKEASRIRFLVWTEHPFGIYFRIDLLRFGSFAPTSRRNAGCDLFALAPWTSCPALAPWHNSDRVTSSWSVAKKGEKRKIAVKCVSILGKWSDDQSKYAK